MAHSAATRQLSIQDFIAELRKFQEPSFRRTDEILPLFPYRITYWRKTSADAKAAKNAAKEAQRELLTLELFNVSRKRIDLREFQYQPGDQDVQNLTPFYVQRYSGESKLR